MLETLKGRLEIEGGDDDAMLEALLDTARWIFINARYPTSQYPLDDSGGPYIEPRWESWLVSCAAELYAKTGAEGQTGHSENGISRTYEAAGVSPSHMSKLTTAVGISRARA